MAHNKYENGLRNYCLENIEEIKNNYKRIIFEVFLILLMVPGIPWFCEFINKSDIITYTAKYEGNRFNSFLFGFILVFYLIIFIGDKFYKKLLPSFISIFFSTLIFTIYLWKIREHFSIENYGFSENLAVKYLDILWLIISLLFLKFNNYKNLKILDSNINLFNEDIETEHDTLERGELADTIVRAILSTNTNRSFGIAINGPWGSGKTTFMKFIELGLKPLSEKALRDKGKSSFFLKQENEIKKDILTIRFNPWRFSDEKDIIKEFYDVFINEINFFDSNLSKKLNLYFKEATVKKDGVKLTLFNFISKKIGLENFNSNSINNSFDEINNLIRKTKKRFVVFIDDTDRLTGVEIITVFKLIRCSADFNNIFFIVGFDRSYVTESLERSEKIFNSREYLKKLFQLDLFLPEIKTESLKDHIQKLISNNGKINSGSRLILEQIINQIFSENSKFNVDVRNFLTSEIKSFRDVIRVVNSYIIMDDLVGNYTLPVELFILETIKNSLPEIYQLLAKLEIQTFIDKPTKLGYEIDDNLLKEHISKRFMFLDEKINDIQNILICLYSNIDRSSRSISVPDNHLIYFHPNIFNDEISINDWNDFINLDLESMLIKLTEWNEQKKEFKVLELLKEFHPNINLESLYKLFIVKLQFNNYFIDNVFEIFKNLKFGRKGIKLNSFTETNLVELFSRIMNNKAVNYNIKLELIDKFISSSLTSQQNVFSKDLLISNANKIYKEFLNDPGADEFYKIYCLRFIYENFQEGKPDRVLNGDALKLFRDYINFKPFSYLILIFLSNNEGNSTFNFKLDPYVKQIFKLGEDGDWKNNFFKFINIKDDDNNEIIILKNILRRSYRNKNDIYLKLLDDEIKQINKLRKKYRIERTLY